MLLFFLSLSPLYLHLTSSATLTPRWLSLNRYSLFAFSIFRTIKPAFRLLTRGCGVTCHIRISFKESNIFLRKIKKKAEPNGYNGGPQWRMRPRSCCGTMMSDGHARTWDPVTTEQTVMRGHATGPIGGGHVANLYDMNRQQPRLLVTKRPYASIGVYKEGFEGEHQGVTAVLL